MTDDTEQIVSNSLGTLMRRGDVKYTTRNGEDSFKMTKQGIDRAEQLLMKSREAREIIMRLEDVDKIPIEKRVRLKCQRCGNLVFLEIWENHQNKCGFEVC